MGDPTKGLLVLNYKMVRVKDLVTRDRGCQIDLLQFEYEFHQNNDGFVQRTGNDHGPSCLFRYLMEESLDVSKQVKIKIQKPILQIKYYKKHSKYNQIKFKIDQLLPYNQLVEAS